jgi:hypothetical protein
MEKKYVIILGNPVDGIVIFGPFDGPLEAVNWAEMQMRGNTWWVTELKEP